MLLSISKDCNTCDFRVYEQWEESGDYFKQACLLDIIYITNLLEIQAMLC